MKEVAARLHEYREGEGLTQQEVADIAGVSRLTYGKWELGENNPSVIGLARLAEHYGVSLDMLVYGSETNLKTILPKDDLNEIVRDLEYLYLEDRETFIVTWNLIKSSVAQIRFA